MKVFSKVPYPKAKDRKSFGEMLMSVRKSANDATGNVQDYIWVDDTKTKHLLLVPEAERPEGMTKIILPDEK